MKRKKIVIGTRASELALTQAEEIAETLEDNLADRDIEIEIEKIVTTGDRVIDQPLAKIEGKGIFLKEIEKALLNGEIDLAVHSLKDVPTELPDGLKLGSLPIREDPRDVLIAPGFSGLEDLPRGAVVGTGSLRRQTQLLQRRSDLQVRGIRGNVDTRLQKLQDEDYDALVLAAAGLKRLDRSGEVTAYFPPDEFLPAAGQGGLALEIREDSSWSEKILQSIEDQKVARCLTAERKFLAALGGGCHVPIGSYARVKQDRIEISGMVGGERGEEYYHRSRQGPFEKGEELAVELAEELLARGAAGLLDKEV
ncbi:hydroxymethylbilane synthase [Halarsenatibacter silvermanii]|uniref:Porphobilinogen deaminase n=1 Tax=Halarsenatibacter silvermanii TaxID=321763 RepID=A0A1G9Q2L5_9FIRM|nr:hydroxymethylbilane synthase [Halarsenatibacter silvermanii]SDM04971.1 hydroxymethylbilane synthase [Halarsenatibacter silvermanii]